MQNREKQIEEMAITLNEATFGVNMQTLADHLRPETINKVAEYLYTADYRKQEWISVEERLPELGGKARTLGKLQIQSSVRVLCACKQKSGKVFVKEGFYELWGSNVVWKIPGSIDEVTHWMPLPEAPKMKGGAE